MIELRKRKNIEEAMETGAEQQTLYTVLPEKRATVGAAMMGSAHVYDMASVSNENEIGFQVPCRLPKVSVVKNEKDVKFHCAKYRKTNIHRLGLRTTLGMYCSIAFT